MNKIMFWSAVIMFISCIGIYYSGGESGKAFANTYGFTASVLLGLASLLINDKDVK